MNRFFQKICLVFLMFFLVATSFLTFESVASEDDSTSQDQRKHMQADLLRRNSEDNSRSKLGYEQFYQESQRGVQDWSALSYQIQVLGALLQNLSDQFSDPSMRGGASRPYVPPGATGLPPALQSLTMYGPEGPSKKSVRLILEYQLLINGNTRLTAGKITESAISVLAQVVTVDGSVVEEYEINKKTGRWLVVDSRLP